jgi:hypothetical protein
VGRNAATQLRSKQLPAPAGAKLMFSTKQGDELGSFLSENQNFVLHPEPLPAVAYAYDYDDDDETAGDDSIRKATSNNSGREDDSSLAQHVNSKFLYDVISRRNSTEIFSAAGGGTSGRGPMSSTPYPPPSSMEASNSAPSRKAGGGGGGRHRCPKCGTTVTFRCDFEENTFYCASCSGWFVANPNTITSTDESQNKGDGSPYEEFLAKNGSKNLDEPEILMRHVSTVVAITSFVPPTSSEDRILTEFPSFFNLF